MKKKTKENRHGELPPSVPGRTPRRSAAPRPLTAASRSLPASHYRGTPPALLLVRPGLGRTPPCSHWSAARRSRPSRHSHWLRLLGVPPAGSRPVGGTARWGRGQRMAANEERVGGASRRQVARGGPLPGRRSCHGNGPSEARSGPRARLWGPETGGSGAG